VSGGLPAAADKAGERWNEALTANPEVAAESAGNLFDATEIDEILTLRTLALTDEEKREARATDPRAADLIDRLDGLPPEMMEKLHGAIRYLEPRPGPARTPAETPVPHSCQTWTIC